MRLMQRAHAVIFFIFLLPGCAVVGSESYFAARTQDRKPEWTGNPGIIHITGKPNSIRYAIDGIDFAVHSSPLASKTYSFGPCLPVPLPVIPVFGLDRSDYTGQVQIHFQIFRSIIPYQLIRATLVAGDQALSPIKIAVVHAPGAEGTPVPHEVLLPLSLNSRSTYMLTYDILRSSAAVHALVFYLQDGSGSRLFKDKISFTQDSSTTFVCLFP